MFNKYFRPATAALLLPSIAFAHDNDKKHSSHDHHQHEQQTVEKIQVTASRLGRIVTESATRTELINGEEIQEKALMRPGNISMLVAETGGVRVQTTSPSMGSANIRLQGLFGRYTQLLSDGLPLYGGQTASIGLLQIPPTDLANVEIIKGSASSLYGGSALGGVINLISRVPTNEREGELLLNLTSKQGQDFTSYFASPLSASTKGSVTAGIHHQKPQDLDDDNWLDMAGYNRATIRPRLYWSGEHDDNLYLTIGLMSEQRDGGTKGDKTLPSGESYKTSQETTRKDLGFIYDLPLVHDMTLNVRGSAMKQDHEHEFGDTFDQDQHESYLIESSISGYTDNTAWLVGVAHQSEKFRSDHYSHFNYSYQTPGIFSQVDYQFSDDVNFAFSARSDQHSKYGSQFSPRTSVMFTPENWLLRASYGKGFYAPTPFVEEVDEAGLSRLKPLENIKEERATTSSLDIGYVSGNIETSLTLFQSTIDNATSLEVGDTNMNDVKPWVELVNTIGQTDVKGAEVLLRYRWHDVKFTGSYLYLDTAKPNAVFDKRSKLNLTPTHSAGVVVMWEEHGSHLLGFEAYYTGTQELENNPYRKQSKPYWHLGLLGQITIGQVSWFVNAENLLNVRQTKEHPLVLPEQAPSGRWTTDIWSRNDGFTVNAGVRFKFGH